MIQSNFHPDGRPVPGGLPRAAFWPPALRSVHVLSGANARLYRSLAIAGIIVLGLYFRVVAAWTQPLWVDEAESSINALTILDHGFPVSHYLGLPIYENTLTEPWPESMEYEFRDSSYSPKGFAVYHGWLPLYSIAAAQALAGIRPDRVEIGDPPRVKHDESAVAMRTIVPRLPALVFSLGFMVLTYQATAEMAGKAAGLGALTWAALSERAVLYGHQARYYSLTLLLCVLFMYVYLRVHRRGRAWDFALLGLVAGLLFHAHQLSALVACVAALAGLPRIVQHEHWLRNGLLAVGIVLVAVFPWAIWSGFFETVSHVPKIFTLFQEPKDWFQYVLRHVAPAMIGAAGFALILGLNRQKHRGAGPADGRTLLREQATVLFAWAVLCLVAFHTLVPAASYFTGRLTLMLLAPYLVLVSIAVALVAERIAPRRAEALSVAGILLLLAAMSEADVWRPPRLPESRAIEPALAALRTLTLTAEDRVYAPPNEHLVWSYYSGLPVQSIAPIRKTYLDNHRGNIVLLERRFYDAFAERALLQAAAAADNREIDAGQIERLRRELWLHQVSAALSASGITMAPVPEVPRFLHGVAAYAADYSQRMARAHMRYYSDHPVFKGINCADPAEQWLAFFYRFVGPQDRLGANANYYDRLRHAKVMLFPEAALAIYLSQPAGAEVAQAF